MIDQSLVALLEDTDPENRKRAIKALAKTHEYQALQYLATVYRRDIDPDVRDLAYKAAKYLRQHVSEPQAEDLSYDDPSDEMLPDSDVVVSAIQLERAKSFVDQAMNWHVKGDNAKAGLLLAKAFEANPRLIHDTYTVGIAENITNFKGKEAVRTLIRSAQNNDNGSGIKGKTRFSASEFDTSDQTFVGGMMFCGVLLLVGFALPWLQFSFLGEGFSISGFAIVRDLDETGLNLSNLMAYSLWLVPIAGIAQIGLGAYHFAMQVKPDKWYFTQGISFGVLSLVPVGWLYLNLSAELSGIEFFGLSVNDFLGIGFFMGLVVGLIMIGTSFMGLQSAK